MWGSGSRVAWGANTWKPSHQQKERSLFVFVVGIQCLKLKIVTAVADASFVESV